MPSLVPKPASAFVDLLWQERSTRVDVRENLTSGKSGAFVALVDCSGAHDGVYILKVDAEPVGWEGEEVRHRQALEARAFSGKLPEIILSEKIDGYYCLLIKIAGQSRILWRPLVAALKLFGSAYRTFASIAWTPELFSFGPQMPAARVIGDALGYKLIETEGGRIAKHISSFIGPALLARPIFSYLSEQLPNPFMFLSSNIQKPILRPLLGPIHGDCHCQNLFVKANQDGAVTDVYLIDLATFQPNALFFFDHAYLELATMLRQLNQLGDRRWLDFAVALSKDGEGPMLEHSERGWLEDILAARRHALGLASGTYPDRRDDLDLQFLSAQVAAGLAFLNKVPRHDGGGSGGLTDAQYRQAFIWSAVFLQRLLQLCRVDLHSEYPQETEIPVLSPAPPKRGVAPTSADWERIRYFDTEGFNILVVANSDGLLPVEVVSRPWSLVIDFRDKAPTNDEVSASARTFRQSWPGAPRPDPRLLTRGGLWYFANGRTDLSDLEPAAGAGDWRRRYRRSLDDLLLWISETVSPIAVRGLVLADGLHADLLRMVVEGLDTAFQAALAPIVVVSTDPPLQVLDGVVIVPSSLDAVVIAIRDARAASPPISDTALLPRRQGSETTLITIPPQLLARVSRDFTLLYRGCAQVFPEGRTFGVDFRRGMPIEWAELAQNLDIPRSEAFTRYSKQLDEKLQESSNRTVNLLHEPSAGGSTLGRRLAWTFMEKYPTVHLEQLTSDTAAYLRDIFQFCSLPVLVLMESAIITESEREGLLEQLREDNTRAVFLWVGRAYGYRENEEILSNKLDDSESSLFLDAYLEQVDDGARRDALRRLATSADLREQRSPFFYGLTAFGEKFLGIDRLVEDVVGALPSLGARSLLSDLALVSMYASDGFPIHDFSELCDRLNGGSWPVQRDSLFLLCTDNHVRVSHTLLAERALVNLARNRARWRADIYLFSTSLLDHLKSLTHKASDRVQRVVQTLFITRDIDSALRADTDIAVGGIATQRRFSPLINDLGNATQVRAIFRRVVQLWPKEPHYTAHLVRHLMYEEPKDIDEAVRLATAAEQLPEAEDDAALVHVAGMAYRVRMEQTLRGAKSEGRSLRSIEGGVKGDFQAAIEHFSRSNILSPNNLHGLVATVQTASTLLRLSVDIAKASDLGAFFRDPSHGWYLEALTLAEESIDNLRYRPRVSVRAMKTIAEWNLVYGRVDKVVTDLRVLASRHEDQSIRRALCAALIARAKHKWNSIAQGDLRTIAHMMERNIQQQGVRDSDIRRWLAAFRRLNEFDVNIAIERLVDWHNLNQKSVEPAFYLYVFYFLRWIEMSGPKGGLAEEVVRWINICQANRPLGARGWSYEWLEKRGQGYRIAHFVSDLDFDPPSVIRGDSNHPDRKKLDSRFARVTGVMRDYRGPQNATLDFGPGVLIRITPLDRLTKDDEGKRVSAFVSFSYDGIVGWDARLVT